MIDFNRAEITIVSSIDSDSGALKCKRLAPQTVLTTSRLRSSALFSFVSVVLLVLFVAACNKLA